MSAKIYEPTMMEFISKWNHPGHDSAYVCLVCGGNSNVAITKIVYTYEVCSCGTPEYDHLIEVIFHRACLDLMVCPSYVSWTEWMSRDGRRSRHLPRKDECARCGRPKKSHSSPPVVQPEELK